MPSASRVEPTYVVATPVNPRRTWTIPAYRAGIERLDPAPAAVGIVTSPDVFQRWFSDDPRYILVAEHPPLELPMLERIARARETLRTWFVEQRREEIQWWIDSDIEVQADTYRILAGEMRRLRCLVLSNGVQGRGREHNWHGIGCTLVHRRVAGMSRFWFARGWRQDGEERHVCEDLLFFAPYEWCDWAIKMAVAPDAERIRATTDAAPVIHHWDGPQA